jgi:hypothetical protein
MADDPDGADVLPDVEQVKTDAEEMLGNGVCHGLLTFAICNLQFEMPWVVIS